ncbi:MAG: GGDEF domain-containing protein [Deltaproteobacteria bacterium]|nr:MAG: GGDEF domain-containing protein [Deltaproteobacteria bacterium]
MAAPESSARADAAPPADRARIILRDRRRAVAAEGLRTGARVAAICFPIYGGITLLLRGFPTRGASLLFVAGLAILVGWALLHTFSAARRNLPWRGTYRRASLFTITAALFLSLQPLLTGSLAGPEPAAIAILLFGFAILLPSPASAGVPTLLLAAVIWPFTQIVTGTAAPGDVDLAIDTVTIAAGLSIALVLMWVHEVIFLGRADVLADLERTANHDSLTDTLNRRALAERLHREAQRCERHGSRLGVLFIDVDRFKRFNHQHGYAAGDRMLQHVARTLKHVATGIQPNAAPPAIARYGGEEFVILLPDLDEEALLDAAEQLRLAIRAIRVPWKRTTLRTTASIGVAQLGPGQHSAVAALLAAADHALYTAKGEGGDRVQRAAEHAEPDPEALERLMRPLSLGRRAIPPPAAATHDHLVQLHHGVLRWLLGIGAAWLAGFGLLELGLYLETGHEPLLRTVLPTRMTIAATVALAVILLYPRLPASRPITLALHAGLLLGTATFVLFGAVQAVPHHAAYLDAIAYVMLTWSLAMGADRRTGILVLGTIAIGAPTAWLALAPPEAAATLASVVIVDGGVLFVAALVALAAQQHLTALRADEYRLRIELLQHARIDGLTGWPNRKGFMERLREDLLRARQDQTPLGLIVYDLDHFKKLNDSLGHLRGDEALRTSVHTVEDALRATDTPGRLGGEEFAIVLPLATPADAERAAERFRRSLAENPLENPHWPLTASFGVTAWDGHEDVHALLQRADRALRTAKAQGRNRVVRLDPGHDPDAPPEGR